MLKDVLKEFGPSSETNGLLGRIHKDRWEKAAKAGDEFEAPGHLQNAIETYLAGFQADWRDAYPGVNAVTLMEMGTSRIRGRTPFFRSYVMRRRKRRPESRTIGTTPRWWSLPCLPVTRRTP